MGRIYATASWCIRVQGFEHPPVHVHVIHPDGKAIMYLDGRSINSGVPDTVLKSAKKWVLAHEAVIRAEWARMDNLVLR